MSPDNPRWEVLSPVKRQMLGDPLMWSDEELAFFARMTDAEVERIIAQFNQDSDYHGLMGGDERRRYIMLFVTSGAAAGLAWHYARVYGDGRTGKPIPWRRIRFDVDNRIIRASKKRMQAMTERLIEGNMSLEEWQLAMQREIKYIHTIGVSLAEGGPANMGLEAQAFLEKQLQSEFRYLQRFAEQIASGEAPLTRKSVVRAGMYADAGRNSYEEARRQAMARTPYDEEKRELGQADHCDCCIAQAEMGWQPLGTLKPIGDCTCLTNCHCEFIYRNSQTGEIFL